MLPRDSHQNLKPDPARSASNARLRAGIVNTIANLPQTLSLKRAKTK